ncbi:ChuX/HutX family heme-like substrate-binding protein, partial [Teichococcus deserti]|uniref:ChuX/HutX family heme-like substrate-binding protein n=1 Tax=Teichococcus deserti TaxID=1817963 RepID=UPI0024186F3E
MPDLPTRFAGLQTDFPQIDLAEAARRLDCSQAALLAAGACGPATPLRPDWGALFQALPALGPVLAGTCNASASLQSQGRFRDVSAGPGHVLVLGAEIDLRLFPGGWAFGFALGGETPSLRFFDDRGQPLHRIDATPATGRAAWQALVDAFAAPGSAAPPERPGPALSLIHIRRCRRTYPWRSPAV